MFTREHGLVDGIAKGAHREKSSFQGPFDLAVLYEIVFIERHAAGLVIVTEGTVLEGFRGLRRRLDRHVAASHIIEFLRVVATARDPEPLLFDLVAQTLEQLARAARGALGSHLIRFDVEALRLLGLLAPLHLCVRCGIDWTRGGQPGFLSSRSGGILCGRCRQGDSSPGGSPVPADAGQILQSLSVGRQDIALRDIQARWRDLGRTLSRLVEELRTHLLERELVLLKTCRKWF